MVLELANDCNLNCKYCYGDGGSYGRKREMMSFETAKQAVDFLVGKGSFDVIPPNIKKLLDLKKGI